MNTPPEEIISDGPEQWTMRSFSQMPFSHDSRFENLYLCRAGFWRYDTKLRYLTVCGGHVNK